MLTLLIILCVTNGAHMQQAEKLKPISMPALGRQFSLGVLYDRRREVILQGPKLWNEKELSDYNTVPSYGTRFEIMAASNIRDKLSHFDLSASLTMNILSGMVDVAGSAGYLDDRKKKNNLARVSLGYKSTTFKRSLAPELFLKVTYPEVIKKTPDATDVVVGIQYGAGAIFTFDRDVSENENVRHVEGKLYVSVKKLPSFSVNGTGMVNITKEERKEIEKFSCRFHGDFLLKKHPGTYEEAIEVYKQLPSLLGENYENSVPVKVWLYPIEELPLDTAHQMVYNINDALVTSVTDVITDLDGIIRDCNDIISSVVSRRHGRIREKVTQFKEYVEQYILYFKQQIAKFLPKVRKGEVSISELTRLVAMKELSPFSKKRLEDWLSYYDEEVKVLSRIQSLPNYCRNDGDFSAKLLNDVHYTIGLTLHLGKMDEEFLTSLDHYLKTHEDIDRNTAIQKWFTPGSDTISDLHILSTTVNDFYERLKAKTQLASSGIQFLVREKIMSGSDTMGITIELYERAKLIDSNYQLTSPPGKPKMTEKTHESISLAWEKPTKGMSKLKDYTVNVYIAKENGLPKDCKNEICKIRSVTTFETTAKITELKSQASYFFTISAYTDLGETAVSVMSDEIRTDKCPPGAYHLTKHECTPCHPGSYSDKVGMAQCSLCPAGTYNPAHGSMKSSECAKCPAGTYGTKTGSLTAVDCKPCGIGTYSSQSGADHQDTCLKCPEGRFGDKTGLTICNQCEKNSYNPKVGQTSCAKCPAQTHTESLGATSLSECIGVDVVTLAEKKIGDIKGKLDKSFDELKGIRDVSDGRLQEAITEFNEKKIELQKQVNNEVKAVLDEMKVVHECNWAVGEGMSLKSRFSIRDTTTREECIYKCLKYARNNPYVKINGVSRKLSTRSCMCVENIFKVETRRYEYCKIL